MITFVDTKLFFRIIFLRITQLFHYILLSLFCISSLGCWSQPDNRIVVFTAQDADYAKPIFAEFTQETGIIVDAVYDNEAQKTVGLANRIIEEESRPTGTLFWNNEIVNSLRLVEKDLLVPYQGSQSNEFPEMYRDPNQLWNGFAGRARILIVNKDLVQSENYPNSIMDLADEQWKGKVGIAKPLFGTTATHAACLFAVWGEEKAKAYYDSLLQNDITIYPGNKQVAQAVGNGEIAFGITDTDDAIGEIRAGKNVEIIFPDQQEGELGALFIPNTLCLIKGGPNQELGQKLIDYLLSAEVETKLAKGPSAQFPLREGLKVDFPFKPADQYRNMKVNFQDAADVWQKTSKYIHDEFPPP